MTEGVSVPPGLPVFRLEEHFAKWEFQARHHLTASDAESMSLGALLALEEDGGARARRLLSELSLGYTPTRGTRALRSAVADTYHTVAPEEVICFAGAEEGLYWALRCLAGPGDHAI